MTAHPPSEAAPWKPPDGTDVTLLPAGKWWDAVRVARPLGELILAKLGEESGAVIEDQYTALLYWLIEPGRANDWGDIPQVETLGEMSYVCVPPQDKTSGPGTRWRVPLSADRYLTDADALWAVLELVR